MKIAVVVPSIRNESIQQFVKEWKIVNSNFYTLFVIEDNKEKTFILPEYIRHYSHKEIDEEFPEPSIIPRKTDAVRNFGFWKAKVEGYDYILTLDDDCYPIDEFIIYNDPIVKLIEQHLQYINKEVLNTSVFSTINDEWARGTPNWIKTKQTIKLSVGGWTNVPDIDGKTQLEYEKMNKPFTTGKTIPEIVPRNSIYTMCGMHVFFPIELTKYMYYLPTYNKYHRWADIWLGFIIKKYFDANDYAIVNSAALIKHSRASNSQKNFERENMNDGYTTNDMVANALIKYWNYEKIEYILDYLKYTFIGNEYFHQLEIDFKQWIKILEGEK